MIIKLLIDGGDMKPGPAIAQKIGPIGINMGQVISKVNQETSEFKNLKVPVELDVNPSNKSFTIKVFSPPTAELLKRELKIELGSADHKKIKVGNASIEQIISVAKIKYSNMLEKDFKSAVKSILGTAKSIGIFVENMDPRELSEEIDSGKFEKEIKEKKTETSPEKRKELDNYFTGVKQAQERILEQEKKAAEEAEAAKAAATATPAPGTAPAAAAKTETKTEAKPAAKTEAKEAKPKK